ncbi:hypothetical protein OG288_23980 [Streptomyces tauricus]|uniref:Uncharacterized protein n=1 Tax=Streptomyces tauricus TaxID=68274 RepID=A0ABZ1JHM0_9ACTN|nr:hypothetical protein [Streptomyces tauricus]
MTDADVGTGTGTVGGTGPGTVKDTGRRFGSVRAGGARDSGA